MSAINQSLPVEGSQVLLRTEPNVSELCSFLPAPTLCSPRLRSGCFYCAGGFCFACGAVAEALMRAVFKCALSYKCINAVLEENCTLFCKGHLCRFDTKLLSYNSNQSQFVKKHVAIQGKASSTSVQVSCYLVNMKVCPVRGSR